MPVMIKTKQLESGAWFAYTEEAPFMGVEADTAAIAISIVERAIGWYQERRVKTAEKEITEALSEVVDLGIKPIVHDDTAPSEITIFENGDSGC